MKKFVITLTVATISTSTILFAQKVKKEKVLEGITYEINVQEENPKKTPKAIPDVLKFKGGKLSSDVMDEKYSFKKAEFTYVIDSTDVENIKTHFNCDMVNETNETLKWDGDIEEDAVEGKILWMKKDNKTKSDVIKKSFSFSGGIKKKK
jgi:hypothetical protein